MEYPLSPVLNLHQEKDDVKQNLASDDGMVEISKWVNGSIGGGNGFQIFA